MDRMNSIGKDCNELKHKYDDCFNDWFINGYLKEKPDAKKGKNQQLVVPCEPLLLLYQECTKKIFWIVTKMKEVDHIRVNLAIKVPAIICALKRKVDGFALEARGIKLADVTQDILGTDQDKSKTFPGGKPKN